MGGARALPGRLARARACGASTGRVASPSRDARAARRPTLAQHDWIHVLADYGSTVESRDRGVRPHRALPTTIPGRSRCSRWCSACSRPATSSTRPRGSSSTTAATSPATSTAWRCASADAMYRGAMLAWHLNDTGRRDAAPTSSPPTGSQHADRPLDEVRAELRPPAPFGPGGRRGLEDAVGARRHLAVPVRSTDATSPRPRAASTTPTGRNRPERGVRTAA